MINERRMILEKFKKNNHQIWIKYDGEIPVTNFNSRLKGQIPTGPIARCHLAPRQSGAATWPAAQNKLINDQD